MALLAHHEATGTWRSNMPYLPASIASPGPLRVHVALQLTPPSRTVSSEDFVIRVN